MQFNVRIRGVVKEREEEPREVEVVAAMARRETKGQERFDAWQKHPDATAPSLSLFVERYPALADIEPL